MLHMRNSESVGHWIRGKTMPICKPPKESAMNNVLAVNCDKPCCAGGGGCGDDRELYNIGRSVISSAIIPLNKSMSSGP